MYIANPSFGRVNDVFNSVIGISSVILAWMLYAGMHARMPLLSQIALALAVVGAVFTIIGSILIIFGFTGFVLAGWYSSIGYALIACGWAAFCYALLGSDALPHNLVIFGLVAGAFMAVGLLGIPGIFAGIDSMESMPWYLYVAFLGGSESISCIPSGDLAGAYSSAQMKQRWNTQVFYDKQLLPFMEPPQRLPLIYTHEVGTRVSGSVLGSACRRPVRTWEPGPLVWGWPWYGCLLVPGRSIVGTLLNSRSISYIL